VRAPAANRRARGRGASIVPETTTGTRAASCGVHCFFAILGPAIRPFDLLHSYYKLLVAPADVRITNTRVRR
jgi:hypothetical protein